MIEHRTADATFNRQPVLPTSREEAAQARHTNGKTAHEVSNWRVCFLVDLNSQNNTKQRENLRQQERASFLLPVFHTKNARHASQEYISSNNLMVPSWRESKKHYSYLRTWKWWPLSRILCVLSAPLDSAMRSPPVDSHPPGPPLLAAELCGSSTHNQKSASGGVRAFSVCTGNALCRKKVLELLPKWKTKDAHTPQQDTHNTIITCRSAEAQRRMSGSLVSERAVAVPTASIATTWK